MKKLLLLSLLIYGNIYAQIGEFAPIGATWFYSSRIVVNQVITRDYNHYFKLESVKDTTYLGYPCKKIEGTRHGYEGVVNYTPKFVHQSGDTIFEIFPDGFKSTLLNFDTPVGYIPPGWNFRSNDMPFQIDSACSGNAWVYYKDTIILNGIILREIMINNFDDPLDNPYTCSSLLGNSIALIEKIGSKRFLFPLPIDIPDTTPTPFFILCYSDNNFSHQFSSWACDYLQPMDFIEKSAGNIQLYPNPTEYQFTVTGELLNNATLQLLSTTGQLIYSHKLNNIQTVIDCNQLPVGMYICVIRTNDGIVRTKKLIVAK